MKVVADRDFSLYQGDVRDVLAELPDESVHCVVTSPPYWGLRDYGTGLWEGDDPDCDHFAFDAEAIARASVTSTLGAASGGNDMSEAGRERSVARQKLAQFKDLCGKCGARRIDQQLGLEPTPDLYVENMVGVFREVRRVLRRDGTCWLNIGDSYASGPYREGESEGRHTLNGRYGHADNSVISQRRSLVPPGLKPKDLCGIPWRLAFALQADGWYLRSEIIWAKPNPMPESVTDRPTKAHEQVFLLTRSPRYFYDADAVREPHSDKTVWTYPQPDKAARLGQTTNGTGESTLRLENPAGRNLRSVWNIATQPFPQAHFATFPQALVECCLKAGCPKDGVVLDPFIGSGTTALVARRLGRRCVGIELSPEYVRICLERTRQLSLLAEVAG